MTLGAKGFEPRSLKIKVLNYLHSNILKLMV